MQVTIVNLTNEEREKLTNFIKDKQATVSKRLQVMDKESKMLAECKAKPPSSVTAKWLQDLVTRITEYEGLMSNLKSSVQDYVNIINCIVAGEEMRVGANVINTLYELYTREREKKQVDTKYQYYPRLKKAKEASLYVFSNKVKIIMESKYVKVA